MASSSAIYRQIVAQQGTISDLKTKIQRITTASESASTLYENITGYESAVRKTWNSINSFGNFEWEGQTVHDFKDVFDTAISSISTISSTHWSIVDQLARKLNDLNDSKTTAEWRLEDLWDQYNAAVEEEKKAAEAAASASAGTTETSN